MATKVQKETLETIFSKGETKRKRGFLFFAFVMFMAFIAGGIGSFMTIFYGLPYLEKEGIFMMDEVMDTNTIKIIERVEERVLVESSGIIDVVEKVSPSVVSIISTTYYRGFYGQIFSKEGGGTGFIISSDGKIITNKHVVKEPNTEFKVLMKDGSVFDVATISLDPFSDLAVLSIVDSKGEKPESLPVVAIGHSSNIKPGQTVVAIGNTLGKYDNSVTSGVISATGRNIVASDSLGVSGELKGLIQTDAAINPGNSGGPLLNLKGEVIGINVAIASGENIGFAIPSDDIKPVLRSIEQFDEIKRPYLGVSYRLLNSRIANLLGLPFENGALLVSDESAGISAVDKGSPADLVGLKEGDIIVQVDTYEVSSVNSVLDILRKYIPNEQVTLRVYRPSKSVENVIEDIETNDYIDIVITLGEMPV